MPRIPRYDSQIALRTGRLTRQPSAVKVSPEAYGIKARAVQGMGKVIQAVGEKMDVIQAKSQLARANTEAYNGFGQIEIEAGQDKNSAGFKERYSARLTELKQQISKTIKNPRAKSQFSLEYDRDVLNTQFRLSKLHNVLVVDEAKTTFVQEKDTLSERYYKTIDLVEKQLVIDRMGARYNDMSAMGVMTGAEAAVGFKEWKKELIEGQIDYDIEVDTPLALEQLQLGKKGKYADADAGVRLAKETKATTKLNRDEKIAVKLTNENHTANEIDLTQKFFAGQLVFEEIERLFDSDGISQKYAGVLNSVLTSPDAVDARPSEKEDKFGTLTTEYLGLDESDLDKLRTFRIKVLGFHAAGLLSRDDAEFLVNKTVDPFTEAKAEGKGFLASAIEAIRNWAEMAVTPVAGMLNKFLRRVDEKSIEEDIVKAGQDIIAEEQRALYPGYEVEDLEFTAEETGLTIKEVFDLLEKQRKR